MAGIARLITTAKRTGGRGACAAALCCVLLLAAGCNGAPEPSSDAVRLVVTPVATPTRTPVVPPTAAPTTYTVRSGDTLSDIAALFGVGVDDIVRVNNIADPNSLSEGQVLNIPGRAGPTATEEGNASKTGTPAPLQGTPDAAPQGTPTLPPPDVTPPLGPTTTEPTRESSSPNLSKSPTAEP